MKNRGMTRASGDTLGRIALLLCFAVVLLSPTVVGADITALGGGGGGGGGVIGGNTNGAQGGEGSNASGSSELGGAGGSGHGSSGTTNTSAGGGGGAALTINGLGGGAGVGFAGTGTPSLNSGAGGAANGATGGANTADGKDAVDVSYLLSPTETSGNILAVGGGGGYSTQTTGATGRGGRGGSVAVYGGFALLAFSAGSITVNTYYDGGGADGYAGKAGNALVDFSDTNVTASADVYVSASDGEAYANFKSLNATGGDVRISSDTGSGLALMKVSDDLTIGTGFLRILAPTGDNLGGDGAGALVVGGNVTAGGLVYVIANYGSATPVAGSDGGSYSGASMSVGGDMTMKADGAGGNLMVQAERSDATLNVDGDIVFAPKTGGQSNAGTLDVHTLVTGPGNASLSAANIVTGTGAVSVTSATSGAAGMQTTGGAGGSGVFTLNAASFTVATTGAATGTASFEAGTMKIASVSTLNLNRNGGDVAFGVGTLEVGDANGAGASVATGNSGSAVLALADVGIGTLRLNNGSSFDTTGWNANGGSYGVSYGVRNLVARGEGNTLNGMAVDFNSAATSLDSITFDLTGVAVNNANAVLKVGAAGLDFGNLGKSQLAVILNIVPGNFRLDAMQAGDKVVLIDHNNLALGSFFGTPGNGVEMFRQWTGLTDHVGGIEADSLGNLVLGYYGNATDPANYKPYFEGLLGGVLTVRNAQDVVLDILKRTDPKAYDRIIVDLAMRAAHAKYSTGSHIKDNQWNGALSMTYKTRSFMGDTTFGAFFETGMGSYSSYNNLVLLGDVRGGGDAKYYGGGLLFHNRFENCFYVEASARAGSLSNDFSVGGMTGAAYDIHQAYYGAHAGVGRKWNVAERTEVDVYGQFLWTRTGSKDFQTDADEDIRFDAVDSYRSRLGARVSQAFLCDALKAYAGAAWEYEFDGKAKGFTSAGSLRDCPDLKGSSAYMEAGVVYQPVGARYSVDAGVFGLAGKQKAIGGGVGFKLEF